MRIAVFCGSSRRAPEIYLSAARSVGTEIARRGHVVVYGGGRTGLMGAVADAALAAGGKVEGVILRDFIEQDVHHMGIDELYSVDDMRSRKAGLDERADGFIALPGGLGTFEEVTEILSFRKLALHGRPLVFVNVEGFFDPLIALVERAIEADFDKPEVRGYYAVTPDPKAAIDRIEAERGMPTGFLVPGSNRLGAALDVARATARRAERNAVTHMRAGGYEGSYVLAYLNRLADYLFMLARGAEETWTPSKET